MALKQSQGHQTYNENVYPELGYKHATFERSHGNSVRGKGNARDFLFKRGSMPIVSLEHFVEKKSRIFMIYLMQSQTVQNVNLIG